MNRKIVGNGAMFSAVGDGVPPEVLGELRLQSEPWRGIGRDLLAADLRE